MFDKEQMTYTATANDNIDEMVSSLLKQIQSTLPILKITYFYLPENRCDYLATYHALRESTKDFFGQHTPLISYIAQKPIGNLLTAEIQFLNDEKAIVERHPRYTIIRNNEAEELLTEGIIPDDISQSTYRQAENIFGTITQILDEADFSLNDIYRQWNYIEGITRITGGRQNYQEFNDARSKFYQQADWNNGYPAATGIGQSMGGVMIELAAQKGNGCLNRAIDNPMQISAHNYSKNVLAGNLEQKTTPKFERARIVGNNIFISGTAAIKGEESLHSGNIEMQTAATMKIMNHLVSKGNIPLPCTDVHYDHLRIYIKNETDLDTVREYMQEHYPAIKKNYLVADICRPELLIEIEGCANVQ